MNRIHPAAELARETCRKFPKTPTRAIASILWKQNPELWPNYEACRACVKQQRGQHGAKNRRKIKVAPDLAAQSFSVDAFGFIPPVKSEWDSEWAAVQFGAGRYLVLQDLHIPYHEPEPIKTALKWGGERNPTHIVLNGDVADFFSVSKWENDPRQRDLAGEIVAVRQFLQGLRGLFPKAEITWNLGNHEERWERYLWLKAPELAGVPEFSYDAIFRAEEFGVRVIGEKRPLRLGKLNVIHGHEYSFPIANPVNPARGLFLRAKTHALCGHFHQSSKHSERTLEELVLGTWSIGCLCNLHPRYRPLNNWNHGFAFVDVEENGRFNVHSKKIIHGDIYDA